METDFKFSLEPAELTIHYAQLALWLFYRNAVDYYNKNVRHEECT